ncbi:UNVERIFIED_CONTAM: hypothetical protein GTU68_009004 [Idotea baltica]|jgi:hypothetical protein
MLVG